MFPMWGRITVERRRDGTFEDEEVVGTRELEDFEATVKGGSHACRVAPVLDINRVNENCVTPRKDGSLTGTV